MDQEFKGIILALPVDDILPFVSSDSRELKVTGTRASLLQNWGQKHYLFVVLLGILQRLFVSCFRGGRGSLGKLALLPSGPSSPHGSS